MNWTAIRVTMLLGLAVVVTLVLLLRSSAAPPLIEVTSVQPWFSARQADWRAFRYVSLEDRQRLQRVVEAWVQPRSSSLESRLSRELTGSIARFLHSLGASTPDEYFRRVEGHRTLKTSISDDKHVHAFLRELTGRTMPENMTARSALEVLWNSRPDAPQRPAAVSETGILGVSRTTRRSEIPEHRRSLPLADATFPAFREMSSDDYLRSWAFPITQGLARLTVPRTDLDSLLAKHDEIPACWFACVILTADNKFVGLDAYVYWAERDGTWYVQWAADHYWQSVYWPM